MILSVNKYMVNEAKIDSEEEYYLDLSKKEAKHYRYFYDKYYSAICSFIFRRVQEENITADLTSQVFLKGLQNIHKFNFTGIPFSAFLYRIATNEVTDYFRSSNKTRTVNIDNVHDIDELLDNDTHNYELKINCLEEALKHLNDDELLLIEMRFFEKLSFKEIGEIKNWNDHKTKMRIYRVIDKLKVLVSTEMKKKEGSCKI